MSSKSCSLNNRSGDAKYAVSANRTAARHRIRYVESGGAAVDGNECVFCDSAPDVSGERLAAAAETGREA